MFTLVQLYRIYDFLLQIILRNDDDANNNVKYKKNASDGTVLIRFG